MRSFTAPKNLSKPLKGILIDTTIFETTEPEVRSYCRSWPTVFTKASGSILTDEQDREFIDFFAGAGSLNYGHNDPDMKAALVEHVMADGVAHGLDMHTDAKGAFLSTFERLILGPRGMNHRMMFTGPTGANAVEAALKLARKATGRTNVIAFTTGFHGVTLGALAATGNLYNRGGAGQQLQVLAQGIGPALAPQLRRHRDPRLLEVHAAAGIARADLDDVQAKAGAQQAREHADLRLAEDLARKFRNAVGAAEPAQLATLRAGGPALRFDAAHRQGVPAMMPVRTVARSSAENSPEVSWSMSSNSAMNIVGTP